MKKIAIFGIFLFLISLTAASADDIGLKYTVLNNQIPAGGSASFALTVENNQTMSEDFTVYVNDVAWNAMADPLTDYTTGIHVPSQSSYTTVLLLSPIGRIGFKLHHVQVSLVSQITRKSYDIVLPVEVRQDLVKYPLDLETSISMPGQVDTRKSFSVKIRLKNNQASILKNITVSLNSNVIKQSSIVEIGPEEEKIVEFSMKLPETTKPQKDTLNVQISKDGNKVANLKKEFEIVPFIPEFKQTETVKKRFLVYTSTIELLNEGNAQETQTVAVPMKTFDSLFAKTIPKSGVTQKDGDAYFAWSVSLGSQETTSVQIIRSYLPALYAAIIIAVASTLYFMFRSPIVVKKRARKVAAQGDQITDIKVVLNVKNRSGKPVHNLRLMDKVPNLVGFVKAGMETAKPNKAAQHIGGTVIAWDIAVVEPGEERVFTYELKPKLTVVGGLDLGPAIIQFKKGGKFFKKRSNSLDVYV